MYIKPSLSLYVFFPDESIEPPKRVQAVPGPQSNTLLVSWQPSSTTNTIRGYRILIDGHQVQDLKSPLSKIYWYSLVLFN